MCKAYFDYASTTPVDPEVAAAMMPFLHEKFGDASSPHSLGQEAKKALEDARECLANFIGAKVEEIIFNSGATESNNHAVIGIARAHKAKGKHIIVSSIEHHSVLEPVEYLKDHEGYEVTYIKPDGDGCIDPEDIKQAITKKQFSLRSCMPVTRSGRFSQSQRSGLSRKNIKFRFLSMPCRRWAMFLSTSTISMLTCCHYQRTSFMDRRGSGLCMSARVRSLLLLY
ncbi:MAG: aminotransferase class V-fold PLP-dependent enzyme [Candidatus Omnitrophica bacterium]|nr:aminotransferase class V-fold PLP-dependent enzyme [Candidatus Omnitrophota bacterium]